MDDITLGRQAVKIAAEIIADVMDDPPPPEWKGEVDPVTEIDRRVESIVMDLIASERPDDLLLGEESGGADWEEGRVWIIDPLDGTVNFVHRLPQVAVSVALWEDGLPRVGVIGDVARGEVFSAVAGEGAYLDDTELDMSTRHPSLSGALITTGFPYDRQRRAQEYATVFARVMSGVGGMRRLGSSALDFCWVAAGRVDGYYEPSISPWDGAAGVLVVTEAGGVVTDMNGDPYRLGQGPIAAHPRIHAGLVELVRG